MPKRTENDNSKHVQPEAKKQAVTKKGENNRGAFILLEGCDRSGKTTQAKLLLEALKNKGQKVEFARFPGKMEN